MTMKRPAAIPLLLVAALLAGLSAATPDGQRKPLVNAKDGARLLWIPGGDFLMGSTREELDAVWRRFKWPVEFRKHADREMPAHRVSVSSFWLYQHEVTVAQYRKFCQATDRGLPPAPAWGWEDDHPIVNLSWREAQDYCDWAGVRLPTEAEWEYAARAGNTGLDGQQRRTFVWGDEAPSGAGMYGNLPDEPLKTKFEDRDVFAGYDDGFIYAAPVGAFPANAFGLFDMAGNAFEWCADWYAADYYRHSPARNPPGPDQGDFRVVRGGSWLSDPYGLRVAYRYWDLPGSKTYYIGFRPARSAN